MRDSIPSRLIRPSVLFIIASIVFSSLFISCRSTKIRAVKCPEVLESKNHKVSTRLKRTKRMRLPVRQRANGRKQHLRRIWCRTGNICRHHAWKSRSLYFTGLIYPPRSVQYLVVTRQFLIILLLRTFAFELFDLELIPDLNILFHVVFWLIRGSASWKEYHQKENRKKTYQCKILLFHFSSF